MIRYFCDKCGKELDRSNTEYFTSDTFKVTIEPPEIRRWADDAETGTYILCYDCIRKFNKWIDGKREGESQTEYKKWGVPPKVEIPTEITTCVSVLASALEDEPQTERK